MPAKCGNTPPASKPQPGRTKVTFKGTTYDFGPEYSQESIARHLNKNVATPEDRNFIGREALTAQKQAGVSERLVGLVLEQKGVLRAHQKVILEGLGQGEITSGGFSPTLGHAIAFARIPKGEAADIQVEIRNKRLPVRVVKLPFVRNGKKMFE